MRFLRPMRTLRRTSRRRDSPRCARMSTTSTCDGRVYEGKLPKQKEGGGAKRGERGDSFLVTLSNILHGFSHPPSTPPSPHSLLLSPSSLSTFSFLLQCIPRVVTVGWEEGGIEGGRLADHASSLMIHQAHHFKSLRYPPPGTIRL